MAQNDSARPRAYWPWQRSLQNRLVFTYGAVFSVVLVVLMLLVGRLVYRVQLSQAEHDLEVEAFLAANAFEDPLSGYAADFAEFEHHEDDDRREDDRREDDEEKAAEHSAEAAVVETGSGQVGGAPVAQRLQQIADWYAADTGARVSILSPQGDIIADSAFPADGLANELDRAEVQAALSGTEEHAIRAEPVNGEETLFAAAPIQQSGQILGIVRLGKPMVAVLQPIRNLLANLAVAAVLAILAATLTSIWLARRLVGPIQHLEQAALAASQGDLSQHVPVETADEIGALGLAFNTMVDELQRLIDRQRAFIANASHELRTPLTNIKLRTEVLQSMPLQADDRARRYLAEIDAEADRLARTANTLLDLSRLDGAAVKPPEEAADLAPMLLDLSRAFRMRMRDAHLTFTAHIPQTLPPVHVWPHQAELVVSNLLDNAVNYTPSGGAVQLTAVAEASACRVIVSDSGPGIPLEDLPHIFDRFYRVDKARSRQGARGSAGSGAGLGLSLVKGLLEQNGGSIAVESTVGQGTTFVVDFPRRDPPTP